MQYHRRKYARGSVSKQRYRHFEQIHQNTTKESSHQKLEVSLYSIEISFLHCCKQCGDTKCDINIQYLRLQISYQPSAAAHHKTAARPICQARILWNSEKRVSPSCSEIFLWSQPGETKMRKTWSKIISKLPNISGNEARLLSHSKHGSLILLQLY